MDNGLVDEEKSFIVPLMVVGVITILVLLLSGLFMESPDWIF